MDQKEKSLPDPTELRQVKMTEKALEEKTRNAINKRKAKLGQLTSKMNQMNWLMDDGDDSNLQVIQTILIVEFNKLFGEFCELNTSVKVLLSETSEDEMKMDQDGWFTPKADMSYHFTIKAETWMSKVHQRVAEAKRTNEEVKPEDSASFTTARRRKGAPSSF